MSRARSILVIEDDVTTADIIRLYAEHEGYTVTVATDAPAGLAHALAGAPDLIVLDVMLPGFDGVKLCRQLRERSEAPVIMLTARSTEDDKVTGLAAGADDYVVKPFSPRELIARIDAVLRRGAPAGPTRRRRYEFQGLVLDIASREVRVDDEQVALTPAEFELLAALCRDAGLTLSRSQLVAAAFGFDYDGDDRSIDAHVARLRKKIRRRSPGSEFISTVFGVGYRFAGKETDA